MLFFFLLWNMKNKLQKHGEKENDYTHVQEKEKPGAK